MIYAKTRVLMRVLRCPRKGTLVPPAHNYRPGRRRADFKSFPGPGAKASRLFEKALPLDRLITIKAMAAWRSSLIVVAAATLAGAFNDVSARPQASPTALMKKHLVAIGAGRHLNMLCVGQGRTTVVFESGLGSNLLHWQKVIAPVSQLARACFYDRAGYGFSDPAGRPSTAANITEDLRALMLQSRVQRPVLLVGHSLGGLYATLYADKYPDDVAGLVLIDPSFAGQDKVARADLRANDDIEYRRNISRLRNCAELARSGKLASFHHTECFVFSPDRTAAEKAFLEYQMQRPYRYEAMSSEAESQYSPDGFSDVNSLAEVAAQRSFGSMPVVVLTAANSINLNAAPSERTNAEQLWLSWKAGHDALAARSTRGKSQVVPATGHFVQLDKPQAVINAIKDAVEEIEKRARRCTDER